MSKLQMLRALVKQQIDAAAEDTYLLFERKMAEMSRFKENDGDHRLMDAALSPKVRLHRADVQQLLVIKEEVPPECSPSLDQEDPEPLHIKKEEDELWTSLEGERLNVVDEADITIEEDEEKPQSSQLNRSQTEDNREARTPARRQSKRMKTDTDPNLDPDSHLQPNTDEKSSNSCDTTGKPLHCTVCNETFNRRVDLKRHNRVHKRQKPHRCSVCGKRFTRRLSLKTHTRIHTGEKPYSCDECGQSFRLQVTFKRHTRVHTGEKPYRCGVCGKKFKYHDLKRHNRVHTGQKPHSCGECGKSFARLTSLKIHSRVHTGEKPYSCGECGKNFTELNSLKAHHRVHTGEKPYSCGECGKTFKYQVDLKIHNRVHTGEKPYSCGECGEKFARLSSLKTHNRVHK